MNDFQKLKLEECFYYFKSYVEMYTGTRFEGFEKNYFLKKEEGYKYDVYQSAHASLKLDTWEKKHIGTGYIAKCFWDAYEQNENLVYYRSDSKTKMQIEANLKETEEVLYDLYLTDKDPEIFPKVVNIFGGRYDLMAYMYFIKDKDKYLPISPKNFEKAFEILGIDVELQYKCSWENYSTYIALINQIKQEFEKYFEVKINLLDAHSFVWMLEQSKRHFVTKQMWIDILKNEDLLKPNEIQMIKDYYYAPQHASICSEMEKKTGVSFQTYNLTMGKAGKKIIDKLNFCEIKRENGKARYYSVIFRGCEYDDGLFEWQVKPELVEALETVYPELRLNANSINTIKANESILTNEFEADNESQLEIVLKDDITKTDFKEFVGILREKPELLETKYGKRYKRDKQRSINALHRASYLCEYNPTHKTFLRKSSNVNYTESHHLVPMAFQELFNVTLDTEANIVSLCSNCHNQIHYGQDADKIIEKLYEQRKEALSKEGIVITIEQLLSMYK